MVLCSGAISSFIYWNIIKASLQILCNYLGSLQHYVSGSFSCCHVAKNGFFMMSKMAIIVPDVTSLNNTTQHVDEASRNTFLCLMLPHWLRHTSLYSLLWSNIRTNWFKSVRYQFLKNMNYMEGENGFWEWSHRKRCE